jgi:hypothetical protein
MLSPGRDRSDRAAVASAKDETQQHWSSELLLDETTEKVRCPDKPETNEPL